MITNEVFNGSVIRYSSNNYSHSFEISFSSRENSYTCTVIWASKRILFTANDVSAQEAFNKAYAKLQSSLYSLHNAKEVFSTLLSGTAINEYYSNTVNFWAS